MIKFLFVDFAALYVFFFFAGAVYYRYQSRVSFARPVIGLIAAVVFILSVLLYVNYVRVDSLSWIEDIIVVCSAIFMTYKLPFKVDYTLNSFGYIDIVLPSDETVRHDIMSLARPGERLQLKYDDTSDYPSYLVFQDDLVLGYISDESFSFIKDKKDAIKDVYLSKSSFFDDGKLCAKVFFD